MSIRALIWNYLLDPVVRRIESRIEHFESLRPITHDGSKFSDRAIVGVGVVFYASASITNRSDRGELIIGDFSHVKGEIILESDGEVTIGPRSFLGEGSKIWSSLGVSIGSNVLISHLVDIHDSNSHSLDWELRRAEISARFERNDHSNPMNVSNARVIIEDDVWIGFKSSILKGVTIGRGAVVAAGSVVTKDVAPFTMVAGNPARLVKELPR